MVCAECAEAALENRKMYDKGTGVFVVHPTDCDCTCQHNMPGPWEKNYSSERPSA